MPLEKTRSSQVVTFYPQQALWSSAIITAGSYSNQSWAIPFQGLPFIVVGQYSAGSPIAPGDKFRLFTGASLKESTVFTVSGLTPSAGYAAWNVFFTPSPIALPTSSDTATSLAAPKNAKWLGSLGHVTNLSYDFTCPGGPNSMTCKLQLPPDYRTDALDPGRCVQIWRGGQCTWEGKLNEPTPAADGWTVTAHGAGTYGQDFMDYYGTWNADDPVNRAINRGLRWNNPGIGSPSGLWLGQQTDSGSQTITAFLNLLCTGGALVWQVIPGNASTLPAGCWTLKIFPFPTDNNGNPLSPPTLTLVSSSPVARTVTADINNIILRYQVSADTTATSTGTSVPATYATVFAGNTSSTSKHGPMEYYLDITQAGTMTAAAARVIGQNVLQRYARANFAGPFAVGPTQLLNAGGFPIDLGIGQAGQICKLVVSDAPFGGEVAAAPLTFMIGTYAYDNDTDTATVTPYQSIRNDLSGLITAMYPWGI